MILICAALPQEMKIIKQEIKKLSLKTDIDFLLTGVGNMHTLYQLKNYIDTIQKPDFIVNIGVCGKYDIEENNFFQVYRIKNLSSKKEALCPIYIEKEKKYSIACSDATITDPKTLQGEHFVDMESFAIDYICEKERVAYIILKKPFDIISKESQQVDLKSLENSLRGYDFHSLFQKIEDFLHKNISENPLDIVPSIKQNLRLTFSETELLKKYINKCIAFGEKKESIFEKLKKTEKKEIQKMIK